MPAFTARGRQPADDELFPYDNARRVRQVIVALAVCFFVVVPAVSGLVKRPGPASIFLLAGTVAFIGIDGATILRPGWAYGRTEPAPWARLTIILALGIAVFVVGGQAWVIILALSAASCGSFARTQRPAVIGAVACCAAGFAVAVWHSYGLGDIAVVLIVPLMGAYFAYTAAKRNEVLATLRQTRAELARAAVAEERLRIARDLHDLLGHSLALITLKAELSRRMIASDADGAKREMAELESVARQSLRDVREAVAGYRRPVLLTELGSARQLLTAAGLACEITSPDHLSLPEETDTVLAWAVREGVTNVVRHAQATSASVRISTVGQGVIVEITDNGRGHGPGPAGSGLAGLGERVRQLGGSLIAGPAPVAGFRLQVTIPARPASADAPAALSLAS
jgi:two-component system, NarL family, sensor histidine kinase DesK